MKKTGIMGGSFNPIHNGHLEIAECAYREYELDKILFIPNSASPHKDNSEMVDAAHRLAMVKLAIEDRPHFAVSDIEIVKGGLSFTYQTMTTLKEQHPEVEYYFLMGADSLADFRKWRHSEIIASRCRILAAMRDEMDNEDVRHLTKELTKEYGTPFSLLRIPQTDISSTKIRKHCKEGKSICDMVPKKVADYIQKYQLYQS